ncbi:MAG: 30S ribosomal protein S9 [Dissulfurimicrobium sp.]|uniref:30S ribosomal protein S9 n=1 Tax=Dissulfurimicrobium TaxID=1769732 RepID=UPI001EDC2992|nr:30S ribosomal protein S9 [Dissulfurimicrobium hydrothermale]UKL14166.1 30S ribosomal protein S9 [Dissulfurimicrobium hydrothermale]
MAQDKYYATGKRKTATARVWLKIGSGNISVNGKTFDDYFKSDVARVIAEKPFAITETHDKFDVTVNVGGGGLAAQVEAIRHGIAKALLQINPDYRLPLKKAGLLTRDSRLKERKKYGLAAARKRYQYSKR